MEHRNYNGVDYKISTDTPPVHEKALKKFGNAANFDKGIVYTYGDTVYVKSGKLRDDVEAHETVHVVQQTNYQGGAEAWWDRYMSDPDFCLDQELEAYRAQYKFVLKKYPKREHFEMLKFYAECLIRLYDLDISMYRAINLIKNGK